MALKTRISKADFDKLSDELKKEYTPDGDDYKLDADYEDVTGLKNKNSELLAEQKRLKELAKQFEGIDPQAAKAALAKIDSAEEERLKAAGEFKALEDKLRARIAETEAERDKRLAEMTGNLKTERLKSFLIENGVIPERAKYALADVQDQFDLEPGSFTLKLKDGIGGADEINKVVAGLKEKSAFLFSANGASGSGASGSNTSGQPDTGNQTAIQKLEGIYAASK